jgi:hypothetical protein
MNTRPILRFGPLSPHSKAGGCWIFLNESATKTQHGSELLIGRVCANLAEIEADVTQIKSDLDTVLREAKAYFEGK